ncbi:TMV resistance protein N [Vitis vinifera]|uniref:TMV resistance protein N n=1 Tax=Vitis vinifera TaxID=29760 RepID=A0A438FH06_VITVI|nr:TMV resistance protein N [Vitis vinifera]
MELPQNWYENNDFLGIAICSVYAPLDECENDLARASETESGDEALTEYDDLLEAESSNSTELKCQLSLNEGYGLSSLCVRQLNFQTSCKCYHDGGVSEQMWVIFYPKAAILESCHTNPFMFLMALFKDSRKHFKVVKCGLQPIYSQDPIVQTEDVDASCLECQRNVEYRKLCLKGQTISLLPIECASEFDTLCLRECKNLESLPTSIWEFKSLKSLFCSYCSQLRYFPEILENMENLRQLHLNGTAIKELPSSIELLNRLEVLNLDGCKNLVTLPESICNLHFLLSLDVSNCSKLHKLPQNLGRLQSLKRLHACGLNSTCCQLLSLSGLCSLKNLILTGSKLIQGAVLSDICCLYSLEVSIPAGVNQLSMLSLLDLGHCEELRQIPMLPSSLRVLDVHECTRLETSSGLLWTSLFNCFKSVIQDLECKIYAREKRPTRVNLIISVSCGMPKWISHHEKGATVVAKLPQNWYKNNDLLGFVLYCVYDPVDNESEETLENDATYFQYGLTLRGREIQFLDELQFSPLCHCYDVGPKMWMIYCPMMETKEKYPSNKWRQLTASFCGFLRGKAMKVEECGIHLIYAHDHEQNHGKAMIPTICRECQEDVQSRRKLCLKGNAINELPTIECPLELGSLCLRECKNLKHLPSICELKSLTSLFCSGCLRLRSFPEILEDVENLRELHLDGTAIEELPASIQYFRGLQYLNLGYCTNLVSLPESICNMSSLRILNVRFCTKLEKFPENLRSLQCLEGLHASGLNLTMDCFNSILAGIIQLSKLRVLELSHCKGLLQVPELPPSLRVLDVHSCTCLETLSSPSSLLGVSLFKCFKSTIEDLKYKSSSNKVFLPDSDFIGHGICIVVPGSSGIPKWIRNQREGYQITMELPQNWYENNDFLGIAICSVYAPLDECENDLARASENESGDEALNEYDDLLEAESSISTELKCQLSLNEGYGFSSLCVRHLSFRTTCKCYHDGGVSEQMWVIFYPKAAILESCHTNPFMLLMALFTDSRKHFKVVKCGLQPIYSQDPIVQTEDVDASCLECQRNVEYRKLCLKGQTISLLPIECASEFDTLCLRECQNLESLPTSIWEFKSLKSLFCSYCSQLRYFPEILENMENLRQLHLNGTAIKELPSSIEHLNRLELLNLYGCKNLVTLPESICNLHFLLSLDVSYCSKLHKLPQNLGRLQSLKGLRACGLNSTCCQLLSLSGLCSLKNLILPQSKLIQGAVLSDICCLYSLEVLDLSFCSIDEGGIPTEICHLSSLQHLLLTGNLFRSIPAGVNQLSMLRLLDLGHCQELRQIPMLPSSLRVLNVHECTRLETSSGLLWSSLFNCFKSVIKDLECKIYAREKRFARVNLIISVSCGMPKWISHHEKGATVVAKLPQNWYKNNDLLGFVLYCVCDPLDNESEETLENDATYFQYGLTLRGHEIQFVDELKFYPSCDCNDVVPKMWMIYYPKVEIEEKYPSNKWRQLTASFCGFLHGKKMKVEECGIDLIYAHDHEQNHGCSRLRSFPEILEDVENLRELRLDGCTNLVNLPESMCNLSSLKMLTVSFCTKLEKFPENLRNLQCLECLLASGLNLSMDCFSSRLAGIIQLSKLRVLYLSHCQGLLQVPELPPSLRYLDVHSCTCLETLSSPSSQLGFSLFKCFKSMIEEFECGSYWNKAIRVVISGNNGIPEWISQQKKGSQITIELPMDWYRKDDFLGFALYSVFIPMACDGLNCELNICGDQSECCHVDDVRFYCCEICGESSQMCVTYYPKVAIDKQYWSNEWRRLKASFDSLDAPVEVKECGYYLIYTGDVINRNIPEDTSTDAQRSCDNTEATKRDHQAMIEYNDEQRSCDTRSAAEDTNSNTQTSYDCTQCTECSDSPMDTTTQNINSNVVDAQDDEEDQMHNWLELLCKFVGWICCRRY